MASIVVKVTIVYLFLMIAFRLVGKRELGTLSPFELVTVILIPEMASEALMGTGALVDALIGVSMLFLLVLAFSTLTHRFTSIARLVEASPTILVAHGRLREDAMNRERIDPQGLYSEMHKRGFEDVAQIRWAILESDGEISFIPEGAPQSRLAADYQTPTMQL
jgi:uncharacterized membrane protein YcaP (DUF421 family)